MDVTHPNHLNNNNMNSQYLPQTRNLVDTPSQIMHDESLTFIDHEDATLLFPATEILQVASPALNRIYVPGRDFLFLPETNSLRRTSESAMPSLTSGELHLQSLVPIPFPNPCANAVFGGISSPFLRFDNRDFFARHQVEVTYRTAIAPKPANAPVSSRLPRFHQRIWENTSPLRVTLIGDSISQGFNSSKFIGFNPFRPCYGERVCNQLRQEYSCDIQFINAAVEGTGAHHALTITDQWLTPDLDLLMIAYGMNDFASLTPQDFVSAIQDIIHRTKSMAPQTEFLLVTPMTGNPDWANTPPEPAKAFTQVLRDFASQTSEEIQLADVNAVWNNVLQHKNFYSLTGNGVNHPNDFGHKLYASTVFDALRG